MMKKWFALFLAVGILSACDNGDDPKSRPDNHTPLTVLAYLVANNNLDEDLLTNIGAMYDGLAAMDKPATLLVYWDGETTIGENNASHLILKYTTDGKGNINGLPPVDYDAPLDDVLEAGEIVREYEEQISTDKETMGKVLKDMLALSPTDRVGLVAGSHGSAWLNSIYTRSFGQDGSNTDRTILIPDMVSVLKATGKTFDFILFDACYMGTAEVCYEFSGVTDYMIVSPMEIPAYGFPYDLVMKDLYTGTSAGYALAARMYIDYYQQLYAAGETAWATISLIDCQEMHSLAEVVKEQLAGHKDDFENLDVNDLQEYGRSSGKYISFDMAHLMKELNEGVLPSSVQAQLDKTVLYKGCVENARPASYSVVATNYCGLGMYIPVESKKMWNSYFKTIDWYTAAGWNEVTFSWNF